MGRKPRSVCVGLSITFALSLLILAVPATLHPAWAEGSALLGTGQANSIFLVMVVTNHTHNPSTPLPTAVTPTVGVSTPMPTDPPLAPNPSPTKVPTATKTPVPVTIEAAGDIAAGGQGKFQTAALIESLSSDHPVFTLGDNAYPNGSSADFQNYFEPSWGAFKNRIYPSPGNHDFNGTDFSTGYFDYFIDHYPRYTSDDVSWYSFNLGGWHLISINSNCWTNTNDAQTSCAAGSAQETWLKNDLLQNQAKCTLAYWHAPLFNSGSENPPADWMKPIWDDLYAANVDVVLNGHAHSYERFKPQDPDGNYDPQRGILQLVAGTGGNGFEGFNAAAAKNSVVRNNQHYGVLQLVLSADAYAFKFISVDGGFSDSGSGTCH